MQSYHRNCSINENFSNCLIKMNLVERNINKSYLAPLADRDSTKQLNFLILNSPYTFLVNNYKSSSVDLDILRVWTKKNNGFMYQPNKNIKARAFKRLSAVLSLDVMDGLVVFIFFKVRFDAQAFLNTLRTQMLSSLTYFSMLAYGHLVYSPVLSFSDFVTINSFNVNLSIYTLNRKQFRFIGCTFYYPLNKLLLILYAYTKSTHKRG